jgi:hypothetical protein
LAWDDDEFTRPRAELLDRTRRRGKQLRQRRRLAWALAAPVVLLAVAVLAAVALSGSGGDDEKTTVAASGGLVTTTAPIAVTTTEVPATTLLAPRPLPTPVPPPPTTVPEPTSRTVPETTTTTTDDGRPPGPTCERSMFEAQATFDKPAYRPGEPVKMTSTFTNVSGATCYWYAIMASWNVYDASGRQLTLNGGLVADTFQANPFARGDVHTSTRTWDQLTCTLAEAGPANCVQTPPGTYTFVDNVDPYGTARETFVLVAP